VAVGALLAAALYLWLGREAPGPEGEAPPVQPERMARLQAPPAAAPPAVEAPGREAALEAALKAEREVNRAAVQTIRKLDEQLHARQDPRLPPGADSPVPFPSTPAEAFRPERVKAIAAAAASGCGMKLDVLEVDCAEYPCIVWTRALDPRVKRYSMGDCAPWTQAFGPNVLVFGTGYTRNGELVHGWLPLPPEESLTRAVVFRARERARATAAARYDFPGPPGTETGETAAP
jgi:hypothetical protein